MTPLRKSALLHGEKYLSIDRDYADDENFSESTALMRSVEKFVDFSSNEVAPHRAAPCAGAARVVESAHSTAEFPCLVE